MDNPVPTEPPTMAELDADFRRLIKTSLDVANGLDWIQYEGANLAFIDRIGSIVKAYSMFRTIGYTQPAPLAAELLKDYGRKE